MVKKNLNDLHLLRRIGLRDSIIAIYKFIRCNKKLPTFDLGSASVWNSLARRSEERYAGIRNKWLGETVFCLGNGPSILKTDLSYLNGRLVIGTNRAYQLLNQFIPKEFHLVVQDNYRLSEIEHEVTQLVCPVHFGSGYLTKKHLPPAWVGETLDKNFVYMPRLELRVNTNSINVHANTGDGFSTSPARGLFQGNSVIFSAIQLAAYMGARRIVCLGIDMDYSGPVSFVPGVKQLGPEFSYDKHCKSMFKLIRHELESRGIEIINSTPGGREDVLNRCLLEAIND